MTSRKYYLYQKLGDDEFKRIPVDESLTMVFLEKYNNDNNQ